MRQNRWARPMGRVAVVLLLLITIWSQSPWVGRMLYPWYYRQEIIEKAQQYGVDPYLVAAIIYAESRYQPNAVSKKGAVGLMQLMPETARWAADQIKWGNYGSAALFEPEKNIELGCWYVANLTKEFGDTVKVLAAYNAGRGNLKEWLAQGQWSGEEDTIDQIPFRETRDYVRKVTRFRVFYRNLYGPTMHWPWWRG